MRPCLSYRLHFLDVVNQNVARDKRNWYMEFLSLWCIHYQWFKDPFKLWIQSSEGPISLFGCVDCGECVEDEWFIVWMLLEISKLDPGVVIRVVDEDGEFLLIECANHLPSWINPENADNRVWLYRGEVSVICKDRKMRLQISDALSSFKNSDSTDFIVSSSIQSAIQRKIFRYPGSIKTAHLAHVTVPYTVAAVFTAFGSKQIVNSAIDILADKISDCSGLKSWLKLFNENLTIFADHCINKGGGRKPMWPKLSELSKSYLTIPIWFNKVRYAKLRSLRTPAGLVQFQSNSTASGRLAAELGLKLCVGLDLLLNHVRSHTKNSNFSPYFMVSGEAEGGWHKFMERLTNSGYFQDVLEGSWLHKELQHKAECHFLDCLSEKSCEPPAHLVYSDSDDALCTIRTDSLLDEHSHLIFSILNYMENHESRSSIVEKVRTVEEKGIPPADDESWMYVTAEELDRMLSERDEMIEPDLPCNSISSLLKDFMNSSSSFKGIEPSKYCAGTKRKPDSKVYVNKTSGNSSSEDISDVDVTGDDIEAGYSENFQSTVGDETYGSMNMGDIMKSLLEANDKILPKDSKLKGLIKTPKILNEKQNNGRELSLFDASKQNVCDILTSDDDELIDLYGVRSECPAFFEDYVSSSSVDSNRIPKSSKKHQWNETKNKSSFPPQKIIPATKEQVCTSSSSDNEDFDARKISSKGKTSFSMKKYLSQLENELKGEPANIGRYIPGTHKSSIRTKLSAYKRGLCSAKKPRGNIQLAQPEDTSFTFDMTSCDSDDFSEEIGSSTESCVETSDSELDEYVARNLCASIRNQSNQAHSQPGGPAANLLSAIGLPVHELFSRENSNRNSSNTK